MQGPINDLVNNAGGGVSILAGSTALSGTTASTGSAVDCKDLDGPIHGEFALGAATGSPDSFTVTCSVLECDTSGGSYAACAVQSSLVMTAGSTRGFIRAIRTKRYIKLRATPAFTGGSSPTVPVCANVIGQKHSY